MSTHSQEANNTLVAKIVQEVFQAGFMLVLYTRGPWMLTKKTKRDKKDYNES